MQPVQTQVVQNVSLDTGVLIVRMIVPIVNQEQHVEKSQVSV